MGVVSAMWSLPVSSIRVVISINQAWACVGACVRDLKRPTIHVAISINELYIFLHATITSEY